MKQKNTAIADQIGIDLNHIFSAGKLEVSALGEHEVVVTNNARLADEQATSASQFVFAIHPDVEVLRGLPASDFCVHTLNDATSLAGRIEERAQIDFGLSALPVTAKEYSSWLGHLHCSSTEQGEPSCCSRN